MARLSKNLQEILWRKIELSLSNSEVNLKLGLRGHSQGPCGERESAAAVEGTSELGFGGGGGGGGAVSTIVAIFLSGDKG